MIPKDVSGEDDEGLPDRGRDWRLAIRRLRERIDKLRSSSHVSTSEDRNLIKLEASSLEKAEKHLEIIKH